MQPKHFLFTAVLAFSVAAGTEFIPQVQELQSEWARIKYRMPVDQRAAAAQLLDERQIALENLQRQGVLTLDVPANQLSSAVINRYLELKGRMLL